MLFFFSAGSVLGTGLLINHSRGSGPGVITLASLTNPFPTLSCPPGNGSAACTVSGRGGRLGRHPPTVLVGLEGGPSFQENSVAGGAQAWRLFPSLCWAAPQGRYPRYGVGSPWNDLEKVGKKLKCSVTRMVKRTVACSLDGITSSHHKTVTVKLVIWTFLQGIILNDIVVSK